MKDVSFWCVVLSIVVIFIIHHILSNTFEGLENEEEETTDPETSELTVEIDFADAPTPVSCIGSWSSCDANCEKRYNITTAKVGDGLDCPHESGEIESCDPGEGECPESVVVDDVIVENEDETLDENEDETLDENEDETLSGSPETPSASIEDETIGVQAVSQDIYNYYPGVLQFEGVGASTLDCKGDQGGGGDSLTVQQAKNLCNVTEDCGGFFHYNSNGSDRTCFKKDVDVSNAQVMTHPSHGANSGFYTFNGEKPDICIGGSNYLGPNTHPSAQGDYKGCSAYHFNNTLRQKCNESFQMDENGIYRQCYLDDTDLVPDGENGAGGAKCKAKDTTCSPLLNTDNKPECKIGSWIPHSTDIFDCSCPVNTNLLKENYKVPIHKGSTRCLQRDRSPTYYITTCGKEGKDPPTNAECSSALSSNSWFNDSNVYSYSNGIHTLNLQQGKYLIEIAGASGGRPNSDVDGITVGKGAILRGVRNLSSGEYKVVIGQNGKKNGRGNIANGGGGGGGGSFFWMNQAQQPLLVAGGGGGAAIYGHPLKGNGGNGSLTPDGTMGPIVRRSNYADPMDQHDVGDFGGKNGGDGGESKTPSKRGGYLAKGWNTLKDSVFTGATRAGYTKEAGFGGGGVSSDHGGGGGGGYSGGGVFDYQHNEAIAQDRGHGTQYTRAIGGGGGGSRFDANFTDKEDSSTLGYNDEDGGYIKIWGPY